MKKTQHSVSEQNAVPDAESEKETYVLNVYCRRNGVSRDAGEHLSKEFESDEKAKQECIIAVSNLLRYYDEIVWSVATTGGRGVVSPRTTYSR